MKQNINLTIIIIIILLLGLLGFNSYSIIDPNEIGVQTTFGKIDGTLDNGLHFINPLSTIYKLSTKINGIDVNSEASSQDLQSVFTQIKVNYHINNSLNFIKTIGFNQRYAENTLIAPATNEVFKAVLSHYTAENIITKRTIVSNEINKMLSDKLKLYGIFIDGINMINFSFSIGFAHAIEQKQIAEQNANKAKNDLLRIQVEAQQKIVEAEAQAKSMALQKQIVTPELIQLKQLEISKLMINKWDGKLPTYSTSTNPFTLLLKGN